MLDQEQIFHGVSYANYCLAAEKMLQEYHLVLWRGSC